jgi:hypothetical protein
MLEGMMDGSEIFLTHPDEKEGGIVLVLPMRMDRVGAIMKALDPLDFVLPMGDATKLIIKASVDGVVDADVELDLSKLLVERDSDAQGR